MEKRATCSICGRRTVLGTHEEGFLVLPDGWTVPSGWDGDMSDVRCPTCAILEDHDELYEMQLDTERFARAAEMVNAGKGAELLALCIQHLEVIRNISKGSIVADEKLLEMVHDMSSRLVTLFETGEVPQP